MQNNQGCGKIGHSINALGLSGLIFPRFMRRASDGLNEDELNEINAR
jgi:hypothetical protein